MQSPFTSRALLLVCALVSLVTVPHPARAQSAGNAAVQQIMQGDADFAAAVASRNRERFLSCIAEPVTFNGGTPGEIHGRDAVMQDWADFFVPDGPRLSWAPTHGEVIGAGDLGYTVGTSTLTAKNAAGVVTERRGSYLTVWRKQRDGHWRVVFDTGSTLPPR